VTLQPELDSTEGKKNVHDDAKTGDRGKGTKEGKVVRDSFAMPKPEYERIRELKKRCLGLGIAVKKSELLRAGIAMLDRLSDDRLTQAVSAVASVKSDRLPGKRKGG
jgi:hypothetical protein